MMYKYDASSPESIENYARELLNKSLIDYLGDSLKQLYRGKGKLGQLLEEKFFGYKPNNLSLPDFPDAGVELKSTPLKYSKGKLVSKERLVLNIIDFMNEYKCAFRDSSFWRKNSHLLIMFYLYEKEKSDIDYVFKIIRLWKFPAVDLKIIKDDWNVIVDKIKNGKAHELSEGDTFYLGACMKGSRKKDSMREQPFSQILAVQRAFSLKSKYLNYIIDLTLKKQSVNIDSYEIDWILDEWTTGRCHEDFIEYKSKRIQQESEAIVKSLFQYKEGQTFENYILSCFDAYLGMRDVDIEAKLGLSSTTAKSRYYLIAKAILGVTQNKILEFEKADIEIKTIRLECNGVVEQHMSFKQIQYKEIVEEEWEDSYWYNTLTKRFFFVVYKRDNGGCLCLHKVLFWTMPYKDLEEAKIFWLDTQAKIRNNDFEHFMKISDGNICHVRPKGADALDMMETVNGTFEKKKCYWLSKKYIKRIIGE